MNNFFVAIFINDKMCQYKVDELVQNSLNGYVNENFVFNKRNVYLPVQIQGDGYCLVKKSFDWKCVCNSREITDSKVICHGDYLIFSRDGFSYAALFTEYQKSTVGSDAYSLGRETVFIGRSEDMNIVIDINANVSRKCAAIRLDDNGKRYLEDLSGKTGIYLNDRKVISCELKAGDRIYIMGTTVVYYPDMLIIPSNTKTQGMNALRELDVLPPTLSEEQTPYVRTPRIIKSPEEGRIVVDAPTAPQKSKDIPFILTAGPSITMSLAMLASVGVTVSNAINGGGYASLITSGVMAVSMLAGALLWPNLLRKYNKRQEEANEIYRRKRYTEYLAEKEAEIRQKYERSVRVLNENLMPSPEILAGFVRDRSRRLWERVPSDSDFLSVRLGIGELDFGIEIQSPSKGFTLEDDPMIDSAVALKNRYQKMTDVPITVSLRDKRVIGVVGAVSDVFKVIVTNVITLHSPEEVKLVLVYNSSATKDMQWANDLPHVWSADRRQRYVATSREEAKTLFSSLDEVMLKREATLSKDDQRTPAFVVLVLDETLVEDIPFRRYLTNKENRVGVTTLFFGKRFNSIPKECVAIIQKDSDVCGIYIKNENNNRFISYVADEIDDSLMRDIATQINRIPIKTEKGKASIPDRVTFLDMYKVGNVGALEIMNHWCTNSSDKTLAAPIGLKAGGEVFSLDIHEKYHGCHGLVAGTTGSGKSEFLQAYILSMMINYSPSEVAFVLVDFKGGDMARPFLKSPHLAATISNLSGNTLHRALISLEAEVKNRQNIFNRSAELLGVDKIDINSYHKHFKDKKLRQPLPHLVIVIDEFAQLKSQHPEFMAKLIDIAQVGRSLGIHLILATQRPSGVVDPQIWSNSKFKVCLKVLDKQDSMDMINRPEAALIKQPGRAYVQVGYDEVFEQIQSGYSGADYVAQEEYVDDESISVSMVNWPAEKIRTAKKALKEQKSEKTQLEEVVSVIAESGEVLGLHVKQLWLPPLPTSLLLESCIGRTLEFEKSMWDSRGLGATVCGMVDIPEKQEQRPYAVDFIKNGHLAIYGSSGAGKSTLIQTIAYAMSIEYSPEMLNLFVLDFDGNSLASLAAMPHCSGYASDGNEQAVENILNTVQDIISERREKFTRHHCANYESFVRSSGEKMPMILLVVDNYAAFREKMYRSEDVLVQLISAARSCGIYFVITGNSKGAIYYKITEHISERIVLNMNDAGSYRDILNAAVPIVPEQSKGRALVLVDKRAAEVQLAVPFDTDNESARTAMMQTAYEKMAAEAKRTVYSFETPTADNTPAELVLTAGVYETKMEVLESVGKSPSSIVIGSDLTTKETKGFDLLSQKRIFVGTRESKESVPDIVNSFAQTTGYRVCLVTSNTAEAFDNSVEIIEDIDRFVEEQLGSDAYTYDDTVLVIDGFCDFYDRISDEALSVFENTLSQSNSVKVITFDPMSRLADYSDTGLYVHLVRSESGAIVGGRLDDLVSALLSTRVYEIPRKFREKELNDGQAIIYSENKMAYISIERAE